MPQPPTYTELLSQIKKLETEVAQLKKNESKIDEFQIENERLFQKSPFVMFVVDENLHTCKVNEATLKLNHRLEEESLGMLGGDILRCAHSFDETERCGYQDVCKSCVVRKTVLDSFKTGKDHSFVKASIPLKSDEEVAFWHVLLFTSLMPLPSGPKVLVCMEDISERKRIEEELTNSEERFHHAMEASKDGIWDWNVPTNQVYYSPGYIRMLGYDQSEVFFDINFWSDLIHPDDKAYVLDINQGCIDNDYDDFEVEYKIRTKEGNWLWILGRGRVVQRDADGKAIRIVGTHTNITDRKISEHQNITSRQEIESIFRSAPTGIGVVRDRMIIRCNPKLEQITGYAADELIGNSAKILYPSYDDFEYVGQEKYRQIDNTGTGTVETRWKRKDGKVLDILLSSTPIDFEDYSKGVTFTALDITKRKESERALKFQALLLNNIQDHVTATDLQGNILYVNEAEIQTTQRAKEDLLNQSVEIYGENASKGATQQEIIHNTLKYGKWRGEVINYSANGSEIIMDCRTQLIKDEDGEPWRMVGVSTDITGSKQSEAEKELLLTAIEQSPETVVITDATGMIEYVNTAFEKLTGYMRQEVIGQNSRVLKSGEHNKAFYKHLWDTISSGNVWKGEIKNRKKNGDLFSEDVSISPVQAKTGEIMNYVAVKRDISDELVLKERLVQAQKLEAIGTLAGGIAHDFNNILFPIIGHTEILLGDVSSEHVSFQNSLEQILVSALRAKELVKQILTFSRQEKTEYKPLKIQEIAKEVLKLLSSTIPKHIELKKHIDPNCSPVNADATQIHQILMNLSTNAYHAMEDDGGVLNISLKGISVDTNNSRKYEIPEGHYARLAVSDTGIGMPPSLLEKVFDPYFTTKKQGRGTGFGLSVVHGIIKNMNGHIRIDSEPGQGTTVSVYLPITNSLEDPNGEQAKIKSLINGDESILLVDDEVSVVRLLRLALVRLGYCVEAKTCPLETLEMFKKEPHAFDLILTDLSMPKMSGDQLVSNIRKIGSDIPVILCTGFGDKITPEIKKALGIEEVVMKPLILKELSETIRSVLDNNAAKEESII